MIVINVILFILSTEPTIREHAEDIFDGIEYFFVAVFTIELGLRLWTCIEKKAYKRHGPGNLNVLSMANFKLLAVSVFASILTH